MNPYHFQLVRRISQLHLEKVIFSITFSNFEEGYYYGQLVIESNSFGFNASTYINLEALGYQSYFDSVNPTGLPYSIIINDVNIDNHSLQNGDEIGFNSIQMPQAKKYVLVRLDILIKIIQSKR